MYEENNSLGKNERERKGEKESWWARRLVCVHLFICACLSEREREWDCKGKGEGRGQKFTAEQVAVICSCRAQCHFYNGTKDGIAVNPVSSGLTSRWTLQAGWPWVSIPKRLSPPPVPEIEYSGFIKGFDWWISFE